MKKMPKIEMVAIGALNEDPRNANQMSEEKFNALVEGIRAKGFLQPILVRDEGDHLTIIDGHHRVRAARQLEMTQVPAVHVGVDEDEAAVLQLAMNRLRGELDLAQVAVTFKELVDEGAPRELLLFSGFNKDEIDSLLKAAEPEDLNDAMESATASDDSPKEDPVNRTFVLELTFATAEELQKARRALKRAAGKGRELGEGLLSLLGEQE